jgi:Ca2+-binding RTX toxin-like protein
MVGGTGDDTLEGGDGNDTIRGQGGSDTLVDGSGGDVLDGGGQSDSIRYASSTDVTVTLDGAANDGRSGEGDNVTDVETLITGSGNDRLTGSSDDETFDGGSGNDVLNPGAGTDTVRGAAGADLIDVRENNEGIRDVVTCGSGFDEVIADLSDSVRTSLIFATPKDDHCERVERFAVDDGPPGRIRGRSVAIAADGSIVLRLACPRRARIRCAGRLRLAHPGRPGRTLDQARYSVPRRATVAVELHLSRAQARRARAGGSISAITRERGVSEKGPRSTVTLLSVRGHRSAPASGRR